MPTYWKRFIRATKVGQNSKYNNKMNPPHLIYQLKHAKQFHPHHDTLCQNNSALHMHKIIQIHKEKVEQIEYKRSESNSCSIHNTSAQNRDKCVHTVRNNSHYNTKQILQKY